jgi:biotin carboxyl carrier protein
VFAVALLPAALGHLILLGSLSHSSSHGGLWFDEGQSRGAQNGEVMAEDVRAEIVASVLEVVVREGDQVGEGDTLVLLESMKMEIPVHAEKAGTVTQVKVAVGDVIRAGDLIAVID